LFAVSLFALLEDFANIPSARWPCWTIDETIKQCTAIPEYLRLCDYAL